eukprot:jgi/Phyca11/15838/fgenesh1_pg.PHYCAscaffold_16_\
MQKRERSQLLVVSKPDERINSVCRDEGGVPVMQNILETSDVPVYNVNTRTCVWRILTVREPGRQYPGRAAAVKDLVVKRLTDESDSFKIISIYLQEHEGLSAPDNDPVEALPFGEANVTFVNSKATDVMEDLLRKKREENEKHLNRVVAIVGPPRAGLHHLGLPRFWEVFFKFDSP